MAIFSSNIAYSRNLLATAFSALKSWYFLSETATPPYNQVQPLPLPPPTLTTRSTPSQTISVASPTPTATSKTALEYAFCLFTGVTVMATGFFIGMLLVHLSGKRPSLNRNAKGSFSGKYLVLAFPATACWLSIDFASISSLALPLFSRTSLTPAVSGPLKYGVLALFAVAAIYHIIFRVRTSQALLPHLAFHPRNSSCRAISLCRGRLSMLATSALSTTSRSSRFPSIPTDPIKFVSRAASTIILLAWDSGIVVLAVSAALDQSLQMICGAILSLHFSCQWPPTPDYVQAMLDAVKKFSCTPGAPIPRRPFTTRDYMEALQDALRKSAPNGDPNSVSPREYLKALRDITTKFPLPTQSAPIPDNQCRFSPNDLDLWLSTAFNFISSLRSTVIGAFTSGYAAAYDFIFPAPTICLKNFYCPVPIAKPSLLSIIYDQSIRFVEIIHEILLSLGPLYSTVKGEFTLAYAAAYDFIFPAPTTCFKNFYCPVPTAQPSLLSIICDHSFRFVEIIHEILLSLGPLYSTVKGEFSLAYAAAYDFIFPAPTTCFKNFYCPVPIAKPSLLSIIRDHSFRSADVINEILLSFDSLCSTAIGEFTSACSTAYNVIFPAPPTCYRNFYCPIPFERPSPLSIFCNRLFRFVSRPLLSMYRSVFPPSLPQEYIRASSMPSFDPHRWFKFFVNRALWALIYWVGYLCVVTLAELLLLLLCIARALCGIVEFPEDYDEDFNPRFDRDA
ncbi:hypothetical protein H0H93_000340 [Arthromyces matolae]|nr:hypothetical protein H0H93_000340 [Arthromyces matolae]